METADLDNLFLLFKISESPALPKFLHECVDELIERQKVNFDNYNSPDIEWTKADHDRARKCVQHIFRQSVVHDNLDLKPLKLGEHLEEAIKNCFQIRKNDIFQALAKDAILRNGNNLVENIDWKLKWVLGSSDLASLREPLLQVQLHCNMYKERKSEKNTIDFEVNIDQLDHLIKDIAAIKKELQELNL